MKKISTQAIDQHITHLVHKSRSLLLIHSLLIVFGVFLLFQDLIAGWFSSSKIVFQIIKSADEVFPILLFSVIFATRISGLRFFERTNIDLLLVLFFVLAVVNSIAKHVPFSIYMSEFILYIKGFLIFYVFCYSGITRGFLVNYVSFFFWVGIVFLFFGIIDFLMPETFRKFLGSEIPVEYRGNLPTVKSLFLHPLVFGWFMAYTSLFCFAFFVRLRRLPYLFAGIAFFIGCAFSQRAKAIAGVIGGVFVSLFFITSKKHLKSGLILILSIIILLIALAPSIIELLQAKMVLYVYGEHATDVARNVLYMKSIEIAKDFFPFGVGLGRYGSWLSNVQYSPVYEQYGISKIWGMTKENPRFIMDTFWPMIIGETGWTGFALYFIIFIIITISLYRHIRAAEHSYEAAFHLGVLMIFIESIVESIAQPIYSSPPGTFFVFGAIGLSYAVHRANRREESESSVKRNRTQ